MCGYGNPISELELLIPSFIMLGHGSCLLSQTGRESILPLPMLISPSLHGANQVRYYDYEDT